MIGAIRGWTTTDTGGSTSATTTTTSIVLRGRDTTSSGDSKAVGDQSSTQTISTLARQLADSAAKAEERDRTLSYKELAAKAKSIIEQISDQSDKAKNDSEVPDTDDPELLARAKQATTFANSSNPSNIRQKNPFIGLSDKQLSLIVYDDSGTFTKNERYAAYYESYTRKEAWNQKVCAQAVAEYNNTGKTTEFYKTCIENYKGLPLIEQVQYPNDYVSKRENWIKTEVDSRPNHTKDKDDKSLFDLLLKQLNK